MQLMSGNLDEVFGDDPPTPARKSKAKKAKAEPKKAAKKAAKKAPAKAAKKAPAKAAKKAAKKEPAEGSGSPGAPGRAVGEARGVPGFNANQTLREAFSNKRGITVPEAVAAIMDGVGKKARACGGVYTEDMALGRVRKSLHAWKNEGTLETMGERKSGPYQGEEAYRFAGEVNVTRGRRPGPEAE